MRMSYSRVETFKTCPYQFYLNYKAGLVTFPSFDPKDNRIRGTALHTGIEKDAKTAIQEYFANYPLATDKHMEEAIKLEHVICKAREALPVGEHEVKVEVTEPFHFLGFIDLLVPVGNDEFDLYDFKYSNNVDRYLESAQLHVYKHFFEKANPGKRIRNLYFLFAPKTDIRQKKNEPTLEAFRLRLKATLESMDVRIEKVEYDPSKVIEYMEAVIKLIRADKYPKKPSRLCDWCDYQTYCESNGEDDSCIDWEATEINRLENNIEIGVDNMKLPSNTRIPVEKVTKRKLWFYGKPFSGKTWLANEFPNPIFLSTDGNYLNLPGGIPPHIDIADVVTVEGRSTKRKLAWDVLLEAIAELEKKDNDFETVVLDVVGDAFEHCRTYIFDKHGIEHESDSGFGKGWSVVKKEFLDTMTRLMNLNYPNIILISHLDTSTDVTKKSGDKITNVMPANAKQYADNLAGKVDMVVRVIRDDDEYKLSFKNNEFVFGGGRLGVKQTQDIPNSYEALCAIYDEANAGRKAASKPKKASKKVEVPAEPVEAVESQETATIEPVEVETVEPVEVVETVEPAVETAVADPVAEVPETPKRKRRKTTEE